METPVLSPNVAHVALIITDTDPQKCRDFVETFCKGKTITQKAYSTSIIPVGISGGQAQMTAAVSCFIEWQTTPETAESFRFSQQMGVVR